VSQIATTKPKSKNIMPTYPILLIPHSIQRAKNAEPALPPFTAIEPRKATSPPQPYETNTLITYATIGLIVSTIFVFINLVLGAISTFLSISAIAYLAWSMQQTFPERKRKHDDYVRRYPRELQAYRQSKQKHQEDIKRVRSPENVANYRRQQLVRTLKQTEPNDGKNSKAQEGFSEAKFYNHLKQYFKSNVQRGLTLNIPNFEFPYSPDFAYIDQSTNLYIDIEIDEPYDYQSNKLTHFVGKDDRRNNFFLNKGWIVIRLCEKQVVHYPHSCCKAIAQLISDVLEDSLELSQFMDVPDLPTVKQWTESEAADMAAKMYRQNYLK